MRWRALWQFDCSAVLRPLGRRRASAFRYSLACTTVGGRIPKALHAHNAQAVACESSQIYPAGAARACHQGRRGDCHKHTHVTVPSGSARSLSWACTHWLSACLHACHTHCNPLAQMGGTPLHACKHLLSRYFPKMRAHTLQQAALRYWRPSWRLHWRRGCELCGAEAGSDSAVLSV